MRYEGTLGGDWAHPRGISIAFNGNTQPHHLGEVFPLHSSFPSGFLQPPTHPQPRTT